MPERVGGSRWPFALLAAAIAVALILPAVALTAPAAATADDAATLHLRGERDERAHHNFTAAPPASDAPHAVDPFDVRLAQHAEWEWRMNRAPEPWTARAGTTITLHIHFDGLDETVPLPSLPPELDDPLTLRVEARLLRGGAHDVVAAGSATLRAPVAGGSTAAAALVEMAVPADVQFNTAPGNAPDIRLHVELHGFMRREAPPVVLTGAESTPSRLVIPGFPVAAFAAWEAAEAEHAQCLRLLAAQRSCAAGDRDAAAITGMGLRDANAPALAGLLLLLAVVAARPVLARRLRRDAP